ncbi:MAG: hypothetical protein HQL39_03100 [Alphaproteobacteria bacterium]|nr:hypothetical protein [Alphaproteobacteria bacterium]MBF0372387.1 hypothetical protein [Alphaproteobacteria bacterium]
MRFPIALLAALLALPPPAAAQDASAEPPPKISTGPAGGLLLDAGNFHIELMPKASDLRFIIYNHEDKPVETAPAVGNVTLLVDKQQTKIQLKPVAPNLMVGDAAAPAKGSKVLIMLRLPDKPPAMGRWEIE